MCSYFFILILQPHHVTNKSKTLIDNIFYDSFEYNTESGNIIQQISNHLVWFATLKSFLPSAPLPNLNDMYMRNLNKIDKNKFQDELKGII